jgi:4-hydroxybenzoate polyprenyltransferase/phosphoserine phosphatase
MQPADKESMSPQQQAQLDTPSCLCVDLDGTLVQTDTLFESLLALIRVQPWGILRVALWMCLGKARLKQKLGRVISLQPDSLPYDRHLVDYLESEMKRGRRLALVTGADASIANSVAKHLGFFSVVICSDGSENVTGKVKLAAIRRVLGDQSFCYAGNSRSDIPVWKGAKSAIVVGANDRLRKAVERSGVMIEKVFPGPKFSIWTIFKAMRVYQWTKNVLVLLPLMLSHRIGERELLINGIRAFFAFSFCASAIYVVNDLFDLPMDRKHVRKRNRPLPSGLLSIPGAALLFAILVAGAALLNPTLPAGLYLLAYGLSSIAYSVYLKRLLLLDVIMLAIFYTFRLLYGGEATSVTVSIWTLAFSMFMFLSLALIKRISELQAGVSAEGLKGSGRAYLSVDIYQMSALCAASGCISALILILYVNNPEVMILYSRPRILLGIFPILIYWQSRMLILANRGVIQEDPIVFSVSDSASQATALTIFLLVLAAI